MRFLLPLLFLGAFGFGAWWLYNSREEVETSIPARVLPKVEYVTAQPETASLTPRSQGLVRAAKTTVLNAEVSGLVTDTAPNFIEGGDVLRGTPLVTIDDLAQRTQLAEARARLAAAQLVLATEQSEANAARRDMARLQRAGRTPTDLFLRVPQIAKARADIDAAQAQIQLAQRNIERCVVRAPFDGRIRATRVQAGQAVTAMASPLAELYSTEKLEVLLPLPASEAAFIDLAARPVVILRDAGRSWTATLDRSTGAIDQRTRRLQYIATVTGQAARELSLGQFLTAEIQGATVPNVYRLPRAALHDRASVLVVTTETLSLEETNTVEESTDAAPPTNVEPREHHTLHIRPIEILRQSPTHVICSAGLQPGDRVCTTRLPAFIEGMEISPLLKESDPAN